MIPCSICHLSHHFIDHIQIETDKKNSLMIPASLLLWTTCPGNQHDLRVHCPVPRTLPSNFFQPFQSYCSRLSVGLLSYDSRSSLLRLDRRNISGRVRIPAAPGREQLEIEFILRPLAIECYTCRASQSQGIIYLGVFSFHSLVQLAESGFLNI